MSLQDSWEGGGKATQFETHLPRDDTVHTCFTRILPDAGVASAISRLLSDGNCLTCPGVIPPVTLCSLPCPPFEIRKLAPPVGQFLESVEPNCGEARFPASHQICQ
jgi:hypothetical protein